jgi:DNA-binding response OmpR family regulator
MLMEADEMVRDQGMKAIRETGCQVRAVPSRALVEGNADVVGADVDLVILDLGDAVTNGHRLLSRLKKAGGRPRILLTSGFCEFPPACSLLRELGFEFIQRPFTPAELAEKVKSILA